MELVTKVRTQVRDASSGFLSTVRAETGAIRNYVSNQMELWGPDMKAWMNAPKAIERRMLLVLHARLTGLESKVWERIEVLDTGTEVLESGARKSGALEPGSEAPEPEGTASKPKSGSAKSHEPSRKPSSAGRGRTKKKASPSSTNAPVPFGGYDTMTAKDILARLRQLPDEDVTAVLDYERAHKKRSTVLKAVQQRLAA